MKNFLLLILILLFVSTTTDTFGQKASAYYTLKIYNKEFYIDDNGYKGVSTAFLHPYKEVKKEWWRYIKSKAIIFNKVSHYELKVPAKGKEDLTPILMVSTIHENEGQTILRIAYKNPTETLDNDNLKQLLIDFKISYFTRILETQIKSQEKKSTKLGNSNLQKKQFYLTA